MAMEKHISLEDFSAVNGSVNSYGDGSVMLDNGKETEDPENFILEDLDSYLEYINDCLTISRMVSDSVIKGMVNAVEQEAAEKISLKELELARLEETLCLYRMGVDGNELSGSLVMQHEQPGSAEHGPYSSFSDAPVDFDWIGESLGSLNKMAKEQLKNLRKEIDRIRGSSSIRRMGSGSEMVGLSGILQDKVSDIKWMDVDKTLDSLRTTLDTTFKQVDHLVCLSKTSRCQWQQEKEFQEEIEDMVMMNCIRSLKEEFEERLWDQNAQFYGNESINWHEKFKEISSLRQELDAISKSFTVPEIGQITSHGSVEISEEGDNNKRTDHLHRKVSGNHVSLSAFHLEGNGKHDESVTAVPENMDFLQLRHMSKEELVTYFKTEMTKMKRDHEQKVQEMTEEYFILKRDYLKEKGSSLPFKRDKEFDILRKKIPEVILKLDGILVKNEKLPALSENAESLCSLNDRFESLLSENRQLRGLLADKKREVKRLSSQVSDNTEIMLQHSLAEANLLKRIENLQCAIEDAQVEASISVDVYKCLLKDVVDFSKSVNEQSNTEYKIMQEVYEIIFREAAQNVEHTNKCDIEDSDLESIIMQGLCGVIFREAFKEAEEKLTELNGKYINEKEIRASTEMEAQQKERALRLVVAEKERLKQEMISLTSLTEEKEKIAKEAAATLVKEKELSELVSQEIDYLRGETSRQKLLISESSKEYNVIKGNLIEAMQEIKLYKVEVHELKQKLDIATKELRDTNEVKRMLLSVTQEKQNAASLVETKETEHKKQMQTLFYIVHELSKAFADYEYRVMEDIKKSNLRLDNLSTQLVALIQKVNIVRRTGLMNKQKLERRCSDLQKAEAEVDLLGDEVDALLCLLEKIYIALDHYSPILQHYPGIMEILKLIRRELSGESTKAV
ncbi:hypothetical protein Dsin_028255 [Dipteronia sinensis]|uniref:WPP domain-associated protein n=1 Tax=Dipteronia sinensis TaxID=43782 RepID=A0AAE0DUE2_9ROSI|nr:hypothetical protein Dsin_028255 [Dipteronia sinensis]